jgi:hypothetical protein
MRIRGYLQDYMVGPPDNISHFAHHPHLDMAASISSRGQLALWCLAPVYCLDWAKHEVVQQQYKPDAWGCSTSCAWLQVGVPASRFLAVD